MTVVPLRPAVELSMLLPLEALTFETSTSSRAFGSPVKASTAAKALSTTNHSHRGVLSVSRDWLRSRSARSRIGEDAKAGAGAVPNWAANAARDST